MKIKQRGAKWCPKIRGDVPELKAYQAMKRPNKATADPSDFAADDMLGKIYTFTKQN